VANRPSGFGPAEIVRSGGSWRAETDLVVSNAQGRPLAGVTATVEVARHERGLFSWSWTWRTTTVQVVTGTDGVVRVASATFPDSGWGSVDDLVFTLTAVSDQAWDRVAAELRVVP
jgi:hypothetical protein